MRDIAGWPDGDITLRGTVVFTRDMFFGDVLAEGKVTICGGFSLYCRSLTMLPDETGAMGIYHQAEVPA